MRLNNIASATDMNSVKPPQVVGNKVKHGKNANRFYEKADVPGKSGISEYIEDDLYRAVEQANEVIKAFDKRYKYDIHEDTGRVMVSIIDRETEEVLREVPPEQILKMVAKIWEVIGIFVDEKI